MKNTLTIVSLLICSSLLFYSCGNNKDAFANELANDMKLSVDYIDNRMPSTDPSKETRYLSFAISQKGSELEHNWKAIHLEATSEAGNVEAFKFDNNDFEGKDKPVYRNALRMGLMDLSKTIDVTITFENESGEKVKLSESDIELQIVH